MKQLYLEAEQKLLGRGGKELEPHKTFYKKRILMNARYGLISYTF